MSSVEKDLFAFAENFPIRQMPGYFNIMTLDSRFVVTNPPGVRLIGYNSIDQLAMTSYSDMPCKAAESAEIFKSEDRKVTKTRIPLKVLSYQCFSENHWNVLLGEKAPIFSESNEVIGTTAHFIDMTNSNLIDIGRFLFKMDKKYFTKIKKKQFSYSLLSVKNTYKISPRQAECLFFLIRGFSSKDTAKVLQLSPRTVQEYIDELKNKFSCSDKSTLIEKAISLGFITVLPETLIEKIS